MSLYDILVTIPSDGPNGFAPEPIVRRVGPIEGDRINHLVAKCKAMAGSRAPRGTTVVRVDHDPAAEHLDPYPTTDPGNLAILLAGEGHAIGGGYDFPDLYARLDLAHGRTTANRAWSQASAMVSAEAQAAEDERRQAEAGAERLAPHLDAVTRIADRHHLTLYTAPVLRQAAELLADLVDTMGRHEVSLDAWRAVAPHPADACLMTVSQTVRRSARDAIPTPAHGASLIDATRSRLRELGVRIDVDPDPDNRGRFIIQVPREGALPLIVTLNLYEGWNLLLDGRSVGMFNQPAAYLEAPYTLDGARAVADTVAALARREVPDPFGR